MPRNCGCATGTCSCQLISSDGSVQISGSGSAASPYDIRAGNISLAGRLLAQDTSTVDLTLDGSGTQADPFILTADATMDLGDLQDVDTTDTTVGYVVARQSDGSFGMDPPSTASVGEINTGPSVSGDGSAGDPLVVTDYDNIAWLEGGAANPNLQSLILGSLTDETFTAFQVQRQAPADYPNDDASAQLRVYNGGTGEGQQASIDLTRDGAMVSSLRVGPGDQLELASGSTELPLPVRFFATTVEIFGTGDNQATGQVTFPTGRFTGPPVIVGSRKRAEGEGQPSNSMLVDFFNVSATGASISVRLDSGFNFLGGPHLISVIATEEQPEP